MATDLDLPRSKSNRSGYVGVKVTSSGMFQPQIFIATGVPQRALGSYTTAVEAAQVRAAALAKRKRGEKVFDEPVLQRAARDTASLDEDERERLEIGKLQQRALEQKRRDDKADKLRRKQEEYAALFEEPPAPTSDSNRAQYGLMQRWLTGPCLAGICPRRLVMSPVGLAARR